VLLKIAVKLFARARDLAGSGQVDLELPEGSSVRDLRASLRARYPQLESIAPSLLIAVNQGYAGDDTLLSMTDEVACFPPVSGG
jgi:molybdopterin converting factor subunit 1